jgi:DNA-binding response OmpR family regulator
MKKPCGKQILIFDKDLAHLSILSEQLNLYENFLIVCAETMQEALMQAKKKSFDIILLDTGPLDAGGQRACTLLRNNDVNTHIIILNGTDVKAENIFEFKTGGYDYIPKPFRLGTLLTRMQDHFCKLEQDNNAKFTIGPYNFYPSKKMLTNIENHEEIYLTDKESAILKYLYKATDSVTSRDVLLDEVWGYNEGVTTHTLETHVYRLRQKIEVGSSDVKILITEIGGYRLAL